MAGDVLGSRVQVSAYAQTYAVTASTALIPFAVQRQGAAVVAAATTALAVPTGKVFRIHSLWVVLTVVGTTPNTSRLDFRYNLSGNVATSSPIFASMRVGTVPGTLVLNQVHPQNPVIFPEGFEFPAGTGIGATASGTVSMHTLDINIIGVDRA